MDDGKGHVDFGGSGNVDAGDKKTRPIRPRRGSTGGLCFFVCWDFGTGDVGLCLVHHEFIDHDGH